MSPASSASRWRRWWPRRPPRPPTQPSTSSSTSIAQPPVVALPDASTGDTLVHRSAGTNVAFDMPAAGNAEAPVDFSDCEVTVEASLVNQRLAAVPLEPRSAAAEWSADGARLTFYRLHPRRPHRVRDTLATLYRLDKAAVRVVTPDVGGGFGAKGTPSPEELARGWAGPSGRPTRGMDRVTGREPHLPRSRPGPEPASPPGRHPQWPHHPLRAWKSCRTRAPTR